MKKLILVLLILCLLVLPVHAYTQLNYFNATTPANIFYANEWDLRVVALENYPSISKVVVTSDYIQTSTGNPLSGTTSGDIKYGVTDVGDYNAIWEWSAVPVSGAGTFEITLFFENQIPTGASGEGMLIIDGLDIAMKGTANNAPRLATDGFVELTGWNPYESVGDGSVNDNYTVLFYGSDRYTRSRSYTYSGVETEGDYGNLTINLKRFGTTTNIENALIEYDYHPYASVSGRTDVNGNITWQFLEQNATAGNFRVFATGYNYIEGTFAHVLNEDFLQLYVTPSTLPNSTNYIKVNIKDASNNLYMENIDLTVVDYNSTEEFTRVSLLGTEYIQYVGTTENKPLIFGDTYGFEASKEGYLTENITIEYEHGGQVVSIFMEPSDLYAGEYELWADLIDTNSGYTIGGGTISLWDDKWKEWKNLTSATGQIAFLTSGEHSEYPISVGRNYQLCGNAEGYSSYCKWVAFTEELDKVPIVLPLTLLGTAPNGTFTLSVYTENYNTGMPLPSVAVLLSNGQGQTTAINGVTRFYVPAGSYTVRGSKSGYSAASKLVTGSEGEIVSVTLSLIPSSTVYPTITTPIPTLPPGIGGVSRNGTPAICGVTDGTIVGYVKAQIACWGIPDRYSQDIALAALIIIVFMLMGARYGKSLGAMIGAASGFVLSVAMQLIDLWIFFALIIIAGLIMATKLYLADR